MRTSQQGISRHHVGLLATLVFALMATQSRGAMLACGVGLAALAWFGGRRLWPALATVTVTVLAWFAVTWAFGGEGSLVERGATGRFEIYRWFLARLEFPAVLVGQGMGTPPIIPEEELGWLVNHPHSGYLTQLLLTGAIGLVLLFVVIAVPARVAWREARDGNPLWFALIASGATAMIFDCAQVFSVYSGPRLELLLVAVPSALVIGKVEAER